MSRSVALLERLLHEVADLKLRVANMIRIGTVADRDPEKGYRIDFGEGTDGAPDLSPWTPHPDSGGANADWRPLSKGQIVARLSESGDPALGFIARAGFGGSNHPPSADLDEVVLLDTGEVRISTKGPALTISIGGVVWTFGAAGLHQVGGSIRHNDVTIDDTHRHGGIVRGDEPTDPPLGG